MQPSRQHRNFFERSSKSQANATNVWLHIGVAVIALASLVGFPSHAASNAGRALCQGSGLKVEIGFARAGARSCTIARVAGQTQVVVQVRPETTPINPSPWYGVRFNATRAQNIRLRLDYGTYRHRYHPHVASSIGNWSRIAPERVTTTPDGRAAMLELDLSPGTTVLAGQPFDPPANITGFLDQSVTRRQMTRLEFGRSVAGIPLFAYQSAPPNPQGTLILLTRQHPPEVAGEWAFDAFVATVLGDSEQALAFRNRYALLILPLLNPDGIASGHWRTNLGLIDLNRDWGPFSQPETRAASSFILTATQRAPAIAMIDFHATNRDVIYAQPSSAQLFPAGLVDRWLAEWTRRLGLAAPSIDRAHNASNANSKTWGRLALGIAAITYEVGDDTSRTDAQARASLAAETFMAEALALPANLLPAPVSRTGDTP